MVYCSICLDDVPIGDIYITPCDHEFCVKCLFGYLHSAPANARKIQCPLCRTDIRSILDNPPGRRNIFIAMIRCVCS